MEYVKIIVGSILFLLPVWFIFLVLSVPISIAIWRYTKQSVDWRYQDLHLFWVPFWLWAFLMVGLSDLIDIQEKPLANLAEGMILGAVVPILLLVKVVADLWFDVEIKSRWLMEAGCMISFFVWILTPVMPE
jgi:hypothetical protein